MLAELLDKLKSLIEDGNTPRLLNVERRDGQRLALGGKLELLPAEPPVRDHEANSLVALAALTARGESPSVYHAANLVRAVLDDRPDSLRDDGVSWDLTDSDKWLAAAHEAAVMRPQAAFVEFLNDNLRDELQTAAPGLLGRLRDIKFLSSDTEGGKVQRGRESIDREVDAELMGAEDLVEHLTLEVSRWAELPVKVKLEMRLDIDVNERKFALKPLADEVKLAEIDAHSKLAKLLQDALTAAGAEGTPIFHGSH